MFISKIKIETVKVLNIDIQNITRQELLESLKEGVLGTPNLNHLIKLQKDKEFYDVYQRNVSSLLFQRSWLLKNKL